MANIGSGAKNIIAGISSGIIFLGILIASAFIGLSSYIGANNYGASIEARLNAAYENNQNILAQGQQKVQEAAQVPEMYKSDFAEIVKADVTGRYGAEGSKATFQFLKEHDIKLDADLYKKIQQLVESYRDEFKNGQTTMIDIKRQYVAEQGYFWRGMWLRIAGFPKVDMNKFKPIITDNVENVYQRGKEAGPLKLR